MRHIWKDKEIISRMLRNNSKRSIYNNLFLAEEKNNIIKFCKNKNLQLIIGNAEIQNKWHPGGYFIKNEHVTITKLYIGKRNHMFSDFWCGKVLTNPFFKNQIGKPIPFYDKTVVEAFKEITENKIFPLKEREYLNGLVYGFNLCCIEWFLKTRYLPKNILENIIFPLEKIKHKLSGNLFYNLSETHVLCPNCTITKFNSNNKGKVR